MKRMIPVWGLFLLLGLACSKLDISDLGGTGNRVIYETGEHAAFPGGIRLQTGEWLSVFRLGTGHVSPDGKIMGCLSHDGGRTWSRPDTLAATRLDCRDPSVVQLEDGLILINFFQSRYDQTGGNSEAVATYIIRSYDNGVRYTLPEMIPVPGMDWSATSDAILELRDGTLLLPVYGGSGGTSKAMICVSRDHGMTWKEGYTVAADSSNRIHFQEPALVRVSDNRLLCVMRTAGDDYHLYQSESSDQGKHWSSPRRLGVQGQTQIC